ncbi:MAG: nucleotide exchange factor GrpE [bacterium]
MADEKPESQDLSDTSPEEQSPKEHSSKEQSPEKSESGRAGDSQSEASQQSEREDSGKADGSFTAEGSETEKLAAELEKAQADYLRAQADMQNLQRRAERDVEHARKYALERFVGELLPVVDNLERAIAAVDPSDDHQKAVVEGVELTLKSFVDALAKFSVKAIDPKGEPFDPDHHQAMTAVPNPDVAPNTVIDVFQKGYTLNNRLVRPAMVVVSKAAE